jgi:hypothetical protein
VSGGMLRENQYATFSWFLELLRAFVVKMFRRSTNRTYATKEPQSRNLDILLPARKLQSYNAKSSNK